MFAVFRNGLIGNLIAAAVAVGGSCLLCCFCYCFFRLCCSSRNGNRRDGGGGGDGDGDDMGDGNKSRSIEGEGHGNADAGADAIDQDFYGDDRPRVSFLTTAHDVEAAPFYGLITLPAHKAASSLPLPEDQVKVFDGEGDDGDADPRGSPNSPFCMDLCQDPPRRHPLQGSSTFYDDSDEL